MALQWKWSDKMGKITIKQREKVYDVNIYAGNALAIFICEYEQNGEERYVLYNFFAGEDHCNDIINEVNEGASYDDIRVCDNCGLPMSEGYYLGGEYACDDECCLALYNGDKAQMEEDLSHVNEDYSDCYYTEWESIFFD